MLSADFLGDAAIRFLKQAGRQSRVQSASPESRVQSEGGVAWFQFGEKSTTLILTDISELILFGDGFKIVIPDVVAFPEGFRDSSMMALVSRLNWRDNIVGKFKVAADRSLRYELETVFPEGKADPDQVGVAIACAVDAIVEFHIVIAEAGERDDEPPDADDWDIGDILNP